MQNFSGLIAEEWTAREKLARRRAAVVGGAVGGLLALAGVMILWGFSVDDAWIIARVADNLATGHGHRFNADGPIVDAVTPFGYAHLISLLSGSGPLSAFRASRALGALCFVASGMFLGVRIGSAGARRARYLVLGALAVSIGLPAWGVSGMETGLVVLLVVLGSGAGLGHIALLGVAAAWRPELLPFALASAVGAGWASGQGIRGALGRVMVCLLPSAAMLVMRLQIFGVSYPLSFVAKPSDLSHGLRYALGGAIFTGALPLLIAMRWRQLSALGRTRAMAILVHAGALVLVGGDWMPLYRLWCPVLPIVFLVAAEAFETAGYRRILLAFGLSVACSTLPAVVHLRDARAVETRRLGLVAAAAPLLEGADVVASLDVGWVGIATQVQLVDLAGVTDPEVAYLAGGHTSKRIPADFARRRRLSAAVVLAPAGSQIAEGQAAVAALGSRPVEQRLLQQLGALGFRVFGVVALGGTEQSYLVLRRDAGEK